jgi:uncharacterized protein
MDVVPDEMAHKLVSSEEEGDFLFLLPEEKDHLLQRGHLTCLSRQDEQEELRRLSEAIAQRDSELNRQPFSRRIMTFILTYQCNLSCTYCFQNPVRDRVPQASMSAAFVDDFFNRYLSRLFPETPKNIFRFILFGGEPLLPGNRGAITRILGYAHQHGIHVSTATNALMIPKMLDLIGPERGRIQSVQVTLDGEPAFHDAARITPAGAPTFEATLRILQDLISAKATVLVRVHLHPDRLQSAQRLIEVLERENVLGHEMVEIYFAPVHSFHTREMSSEDLALFSDIFQYVALKQKKPPIQNFDFLEQLMEAKSINNRPQPRYCMVSTGRHCAVDPFGDLYECLEEAGVKSRRIGRLSEGKIETFPLRDIYLKKYLANRPECLQCSIALFCGGGCISQTRTPDDLTFRQFCRQTKIFVQQTLKTCFLLKQAGETGRRPEAIC